MDHSEAVAANASDRYLLGELNEPERFEFEAHYFECEICAEEVRAGAAFARGVKGVYAGERAVRPLTAVVVPEPRSRGWRNFSAASLVPVAAALAFASLAGYQAMVTIPEMRQDAESRISPPVVLRDTARGDELPVVVIRNGEPVPPLQVDVNSAAPGEALICEVIDPAGRVRIRKTTVAPPPGAPLIVVLERAATRQAGTWAVRLRTPQGVDSGHYSFSIQLK